MLRRHPGLLILLLCLAAGCAKSTTPPSPPKIGGGGSPSVTRAKVTPLAPELLAVGKPAPEIEGEDIDGMAFKLSDYRGKVVLLDFWGNW